MSVHAQYMVKCEGGGWLVTGRPLKCHRISTEFASIAQAQRAAATSGWELRNEGREHWCPLHRDGTHVHNYVEMASWPAGPDGETGSLRGCFCGAQITTEED